jgi:phenylpropionate dioxygenase-like ring-hydroxylating dioxygenase large terminal subunit
MASSGSGPATKRWPIRPPSTTSSGRTIPEWAYGGGLYHINCDYRLMVDNLMDLTHETYVHASSIGQKEIDEAPVTTKVEGEQVVTSRFMENIMPPPFWQAALRGNGLADDVPVDRWQICRFNAPSHVMIEVGVAHAGKGGYHADPAHKASSHRGRLHHAGDRDLALVFLGHGAQLQAGDEELTRTIREGQGKIFSEDREMLELQQQNILRHPERKLLMLNIDAGGVQSRRIIDRGWRASRQGEARHEHDRGARRRKTREAEAICSYELVRVDGARCRLSRPARTSTSTCRTTWCASTRCATRPARRTATRSACCATPIRAAARKPCTTTSTSARC